MWKIRKLRSSDFKDYCSNELSYYMELVKDPSFGIGSYGKTVNKTLLAKHFKAMLKDMKVKKLVVLVAENDKGHIIGMAEARGNAWAEAPHVADIGYSVVKDHRGKGLGTELVKEIIKKCSGKYEIVTAGTFDSNTASKKLLRKLGFKTWGIGKGFVKRGRLYMDSELWYLRLR